MLMKIILLSWLTAISFISIAQVDSTKCQSRLTENIDKVPQLKSATKMTLGLEKIGLKDSLLVELLVDCNGKPNVTTITGNIIDQSRQKVIEIINGTKWIAAAEKGEPVSFKCKLLLSFNVNQIFKVLVTPINAAIGPANVAYSLEEIYASTSWSFPITVLSLTSENINQLSIEPLKMTFVKVIDLEDNNLSSLPKEIGQLKNLEELYLYNNKLTELPIEFQNLKSLRTLSVAYNNLKLFPSTILKLKKLKVIDLSNNNIGDIPIEIEKLSVLETLVIRNNDLTKVPESLFKLKNLKNLDLTGNAISKEDLNVIKQRLKGTNVILN